MTGRPAVGVTMGDPAGIGAEVIVKAYPDARRHADVLVIGDADAMRAAVDLCGSDLAIDARPSVPGSFGAPDAITVLDLDNIEGIDYGVVDAAYGAASLAYVERAIELTTEGVLDAMATAPINKRAIHAAGSGYAGHTELLAGATDTDDYSMMLIEGPLRVSHVSTHVPLREACDRVTTDRVATTVRVTHEALLDLGVEAPAIAVAGLNPHAGEGTLLGDEDEEEIQPAVGRARERGIDASGPVSPDTVFVRAAGGEFDCVVAMYHDQGHIPVKMLGFGDGEAISGVNVTIGLRIVRTSVDHGTAFDIAGTGVASAASMVDAIRVAAEAAPARD